MAEGRGWCLGLHAGAVVECKSGVAGEAVAGAGLIRGLTVGDKDDHALVIGDLVAEQALGADEPGLGCAEGDGDRGRGGGGRGGHCGQRRNAGPVAELISSATFGAEETSIDGEAVGGEFLTEAAGGEGVSVFAEGAAGDGLGDAVGVVALSVLKLKAEVTGEAHSRLKVVAGAEDGNLNTGSS